MAERIACVDFSKAPKDFRQVALEPGYPLLDRTNANARIVSKWLGRLAAEPERRGEVVSWYVRSEQGARLDGVPVCPIAAKDLKGGLKSELAEVQNRLDAADPRTRAEQAVHRTLKDNLAALTEKPGRSDLDSYFLKYQDEQGQWRLLWMWGYERTDPAGHLPAAICGKDDCRTLFLNSAEAKGKCPHCKTALPIPPNPMKRLAVAVVLLLLMAGAGLGGWWYLQPRAMLKGMVLWSGNNQPVANAEVRIPSLNLTTQTDEAGQFQLLRLPEGSAEIEIAAVGFHPKTQTETLTAGEETSLKIPLEGNAALTGHIINGVSKSPVEEAAIQIVGTELKGKSNHKGEFRIEGLPGGGRQIHVSAAGFPEKDMDVKLTAEKAEHITVPLIGEAILAGQILQANNEQPISGAKAEVVGTGQSAEADADGWFVIKNLPAGKAELVVSAEGFASKPSDILLAAGKERSERVLLLGAGILLGTVLSASDNKPIPVATVQIEGTRLSAQTDPSGRFSLPGIPTGTVRVMISAPGYLTAKLDRLASRQADEYRCQTGRRRGLGGQGHGWNHQPPAAQCRGHRLGLSQSVTNGRRRGLQSGRHQSGTGHDQRESRRAETRNGHKNLRAGQRNQSGIHPHRRCETHGNFDRRPHRNTHRRGRGADPGHRVEREDRQGRQV